MGTHSIALFGEAEKGKYETPYYCESLTQLVDYFGHPPQESIGLYYAIQALLYNRSLFFFRVKEEGFSQKDYLTGVKLLENNQIISRISAICLPGVGDSAIIQAIIPLCINYHRILIINESDLYDYLKS